MVSWIGAFVGVMAVLSANASKMSFKLHRTEQSSSNPLLMNDIFGARLHNMHDIMYKGTITTTDAQQKEQKFTVVFDTGSGVFWLPGSGCSSTGPHATKCQNGAETINGEGLLPFSDLPEAQAAGRGRRGRRRARDSFNISYGTGRASGKYFHLPQVKIGEGEHALIIKDVPVGVANEIEYFDHGIVGCSRPEFHGHPEPLFYRLMKDKVLDQNVFTMFMKKCNDECDDGGEMTIGGLDHDNCLVDDIHWVPVIPGTSMWRFNVTHFKMGSIDIDVMENAITDTGTSYIQFPTEIFNKVVAELGAQKEGEFYTVPCNTKFQMEFGMLSKPEDAAGNAKRYMVDEKDVILNQGFGMEGANDSRCVVAIGDAGHFNMFLLGDAFIRGLCQVYDMQNDMVGFALPKKGHSNAEVKNPADQKDKKEEKKEDKPVDGQKPADEQKPQDPTPVNPQNPQNPGEPAGPQNPNEQPAQPGQTPGVNQPVDGQQPPMQTIDQP